MPAAPPAPPPPVFSFGVIADIQYAPVKDGASFSGVPRYYRSALDSTRAAASAWKDIQPNTLSFAVNLGDTIDGLAASPEATRQQPVLASLSDVMSALGTFPGPTHSVYGNHELYAMSREEIKTHLHIPMQLETEDQLVGYYTTRPAPGWKFVFVDTYDECVMGRTGSKLARAEALLSSNNPNFDRGEINSPEGLVGAGRRWVAFNGGVGATQLKWIESELAASRSASDRVVLLAHQPFHPDSSNPMCLPHNYEALLQLTEAFSDTVVATFSGHTHNSGYARSEKGVHHVVFDAVLESKPGVATHSVVRVHDDRMVIEGFGDQRSYDLALNSTCSVE
ncbi:hypothetical protein TeGR_g14506 [Tetraparma gracilis]|uniref:Calcineurin-like phosphoesterase domain-containing protein n=1 Tax=Tetraparma gracilis TaxID=2962635 RepID=A0ABQ6MB76_9STRA|nr:hypothetical protein TeGR_g14506 [Tetraparma gracilis]